MPAKELTPKDICAAFYVVRFVKLSSDGSDISLSDSHMELDCG
jgi:hypothetical protein